MTFFFYFTSFRVFFPYCVFVVTPCSSKNIVEGSFLCRLSTPVIIPLSLKSPLFHATKFPRDPRLFPNTQFSPGPINSCRCSLVAHGQHLYSAKNQCSLTFVVQTWFSLFFPSLSLASSPLLPKLIHVLFDWFLNVFWHTTLNLLDWHCYYYYYYNIILGRL